MNFCYWRNISCWTKGGKKLSTKEKRWYKDVGLGFKTPTEAINGTYIGAFFHDSTSTFFSDKCIEQTKNVHSRETSLYGVEY